MKDKTIKIYILFNKICSLLCKFKLSFLINNNNSNSLLIKILYLIIWTMMMKNKNKINFNSIKDFYMINKIIIIIQHNNNLKDKQKY